MNTTIRSLSLGHPLRARLIKFRHGAARDQSNKTAPAASAPSGGAPGKTMQLGEPIEDFQLPPRWRRRPLDEKEIDSINSGGAY